MNMSYGLYEAVCYGDEFDILRESKYGCSNFDVWKGKVFVTVHIAIDIITSGL